MTPIFDPDAERTKRVNPKPAGHTGEIKLNELYQEVILDHNKRPRNFKKLDHATSFAHGINPLCGDSYYVYLERGAGDVIKAVSFEGEGCAISKSSASMMTTMVEGKTPAEAAALKDAFIHLLTHSPIAPAEREKVGRLKIFEGVRQYPIRVKCATLAWRALEEALKENDTKLAEVSTEE